MGVITPGVVEIHGGSIVNSCILDRLSTGFIDAPSITSWETGAGDSSISVRSLLRIFGDYGSRLIPVSSLGLGVG